MMTMILKTTTFKYNPHIDEYLNQVKNGEIVVCEEQKQLVEFVEWKLDQPGIQIDHQIIEDSINKPKPYFDFELFPWQRFLNALIFGVRDAEGHLLFDRILIIIGRGAGKNGYIAWDSFFMMSGYHGIRGYDIDIVATSEDQAKTSFEDVFNALDAKWSKLKKVFYKSKMLIQHYKTKSKLNYNTSNARTKDGKRSGCIVFDEMHEYEDYSNVKVFTSGLGKKPDPRTFYITTEGYVRGGVLDDLKEEAKMVLAKELPRSTLLPFICRLDDPEEVHDEKMWAKANPSYPYNKHLQREMQTEYHDMQFNAAMRIEFLTKRMNCPVDDTRKEVASYKEVLATNQPIPEDIKGIEAIGGLDYAQIRDFCSVGLLFRKDGKRYWIQHTFMHHTAPKLQQINPEIIALAIEKGLLTVVYEDSIDAKHVSGWFLDMAKKFRIKQINMDQYRATILKEEFERIGFDIHIVRKGPATHAMLSPLVEELFVKQNLVFGDDPLMRWYVGNVYKEEKGNGNIEYLKIDKEKRKTDGFFAFLHALNSDAELKEPVKLRVYKSINF